MFFKLAKSQDYTSCTNDVMFYVILVYNKWGFGSSCNILVRSNKYTFTGKKPPNFKTYLLFINTGDVVIGLILYISYQALQEIQVLMEDFAYTFEVLVLKSYTYFKKSVI